MGGGMTVAELMERMDCQEFAEWQEVIIESYPKDE
jgi:hypothetical protein